MRFAALLKPVLTPLVIAGAVAMPVQACADTAQPLPVVRFATFNASLNRGAEGDLIRDLSKPDDPQALAVAEIIQRTAPDVLLLNEFDYDADGTEDRNGRRNADEIRFWADYIAPATSGCIYDDAGRGGSLKHGAAFVVMGDLNADPFDGDSIPGAAQLLLRHPRVNTDKTPASAGAIDAAMRQGLDNAAHVGDPALDTADFGESPFGPGNLRVDYVLPSRPMRIARAGVFWPKKADPLFPLVGDFPFPSSDHRLVWADIRPVGALHLRRQNLACIGEVRLPTGLDVLGTVLGGHSGIDYDERRDAFVAISDDRDDARFCELTIDLSDGLLREGDIAFTKVTRILDDNGTVFAPGAVDPEAIRISKAGDSLYWTSEGDAARSLPPLVREMTRDGVFTDSSRHRRSSRPWPTGAQASATTRRSRACLYLHRAAASIPPPRTRCIRTAPRQASTKAPRAASSN